MNNRKKLNYEKGGKGEDEREELEVEESSPSQRIYSEEEEEEEEEHEEHEEDKEQIKEDAVPLTPVRRTSHGMNNSAGSISNANDSSSSYQDELVQVEKLRKLLRRKRLQKAKALRKQRSEGSLMASSPNSDQTNQIKLRATSARGLSPVNTSNKPLLVERITRSSSKDRTERSLSPSDLSSRRRKSSNRPLHESLTISTIPLTLTEPVTLTLPTAMITTATTAITTEGLLSPNSHHQNESNITDESALTGDSALSSAESEFYKPYTVPLQGAIDESSSDSSDDDGDENYSSKEQFQKNMPRKRSVIVVNTKRRRSSANSVATFSSVMDTGGRNGIGNGSNSNSGSGSSSNILRQTRSVRIRDRQPRSKNTFKNVGRAISFFQTNKRNFIISQGDIDAKDIVDRIGLPKYEIARVDHHAFVPGQAFAHGYVRRRVEIRKAAVEMITASFEKFHYRKSFWTIVPKIPPNTKSIFFADSKRRLFRKDTSEGDHESCFTDSFTEGSDDSISASIQTEEEMADTNEEASFFVTRVSENVVLVRANENEEYIKLFDEFDIPDLDLPSGYDVLINPFFFAGESYFEEVARDTTCVVSREDFVYGSTLAPVTGRGFLLCFGQAWQDYVIKITDRCKRGEDPKVTWPKFLDKVHSPTGPAPDYFDIPKGYWIYATGMMLGIYKNVGVRELWAVGGLVGMYSFARRQQAVEHNRDIAVVFAMLREATYGCRSRKLGVRLLHYLPSTYHDDYFALCTLPWSSSKLVSRTQEKSITRKPETQFRSRRQLLPNHHRTRGASYRIKYRKAGRNRNNFAWNMLQKVPKSLRIFVPEEEDSDEFLDITLTASRYIITVDNPKDRGTMNFLGAIGLEMIGIEYPTLIEDYMNVVSESFFGFDDAKQELRKFSESEQMLPGAVIRAANFEESSGGVLNVIQEGVSTSNGHIEWMMKYSFFDAISTLLMLIVASMLGWHFNTGAFHFTMAITVLTRINEEVSFVGTFYVLVYGRRYGYMMYEDSVAQFAVPAALGAVEVAYELVEDEENIHIARWVLVLAGLFAGGIIVCTLLARLRFRMTDGQTYTEVLQRDGSLECLLTGENETGFRSIDHPHGPGVGPLQAQLFSLCESHGGDVASSTATAPYHVSGHWMVAGTLQRNHDLDFGMGVALEANSAWNVKEIALSEVSSGVEEAPKDQEQCSNAVL